MLDSFRPQQRKATKIRTLRYELIDAHGGFPTIRAQVT